MAELKLKIPSDVKEEIDRHSDIEWSKVFEKAAKHELEERAKRQLLLFALDKVLGQSKLTEKDALELGEKAKEGMWKRFQAEGW